MLKRIIILLFISIISLWITNVSGYIWLGIEEEQEKLYELVDDLENEKRREIWNFIRDYKKYNSKIKIEELQKKYKIWKIEKSNINLYQKKKKEAFEKIVKISKEISILVENQKEENNYEIKNKILSELKLNWYIPFRIKNSNKSFYKQIIKIENEWLHYWDNLTEKLNKYNLLLVKEKKQEWKIDGLEEMEYIEQNLKDFYEKKEFNKLNSENIKIEDLKKWIEVDFTKEFKEIKKSNSLFIVLYVEYNWLYIKIDWRDYVTLDNSEIWKLNFLEELFENKNSSRKKEIELMLERDFSWKEKNYYLEEKIKNVLIKIENKINNKEKFKTFLNKIKRNIENIEDNYGKEWLKIAGKINKNSNLEIILEEYKKYKYKSEVIDILLKQIGFKLKEPFYDMNINELTDFNSIK